MNIFSYKLSGLAFAALLAGSAAGTGTPVHAAPAPAASAVVEYADLNLASDAGVRRLQARIRSAAERLCTEPGTASVAQFAVGKACIAATVEAAQPQVRLAIARNGEQQFAAVTIDKAR
jgi:UrcA family protein